MNDILVTPLGYSLSMGLIVIPLIMITLWNPSYFGWGIIGFNTGLWLGNWIRWMLIK